MEQPHREKIKTYFDQHAQDWNDYYGGTPLLLGIVLNNRKRLGFEYVRKYAPAGGRVLDVGCGAGLLALELAEAGYTVEGVDIAPGMIERSRANQAARGVPAERCSFRVADVFAGEAGGAAYDAIVGMGFIQYQEDELAALGKLHAMLKPGGLLVLSGPVGRQLSNYFGLADPLRKLRGRSAPPSAETRLLHDISRNGYSVGRFRAILRRAGFDWLGYRGHGYIHFQFIVTRVGLRGNRMIHNFFTALAKIIPPIQRFANDLVVAARRKG